jgi:hypothetical protein
MKAVLVFLLLASPVIAQNKLKDAAIAPGCGAANAKFEVTTDKRQRTVAQPEARKALVYFIEDDSAFGSGLKPTTRAGVDGGWVGATHGNSYFYFFLDPGEHHLCASWQTAIALFQGRKTAAAHFTAEAGKVYYEHQGTADIDFTPLDSDDGPLLVGKFSLSTFHPKT